MMSSVSSITQDVLESLVLFPACQDELHAARTVASWTSTAAHVLWIHAYEEATMRRASVCLEHKQEALTHSCTITQC